MPPATTDDDHENHPDRPMRRLSPSEIRFVGTVRQFRILLHLQCLALEGRLGGPYDGEACQPDR
jgi:hypothetical protein